MNGDLKRNDSSHKLSIWLEELYGKEISAKTATKAKNFIYRTFHFALIKFIRAADNLFIFERPWKLNASIL